MSAAIFIEGGARDSKQLRIECQRAFSKLMEAMGVLRFPKPRLIACGNRHDVYERFCLEHAQRSAEYVGMWIDSEEPVANAHQPWHHLHQLREVERWPRPEGAKDAQVLFMTTSMETWIAADRRMLQEFFGKALNEHQLPPLQNLENRSRADIYDRLRRATQHCRVRYDKGATSFELFARLNPSALQSLPSFIRAREILAAEL